MKAWPDYLDVLSELSGFPLFEFRATRREAPGEPEGRRIFLRLALAVVRKKWKALMKVFTTCLLRELLRQPACGVVGRRAYA
jgi:hypothetical protein